nr:trypsin-like peptidase domain-containing protein [uncultured Alloprevotella sp.]
MKKLALIFLLSLVCLNIHSQTTYFTNSHPVGDSKETARLYSLEIQENGVIVTIELTAVKFAKRLNYWCSTNCYLAYGNIKLAIVAGYYVDGEIKQCGVGQEWGWSNVLAGEKRYYKLYFNGTIPPGLTTISVIDEGTYYWNGYSNKLVHSYSFRDYTITNPRKNYTSFTSEYAIKQHIDSNNDGYCGIYEQVAGNQNYKLACVKYKGKHVLIYMSSTTGLNWWEMGDIKAYLHKSASGIFKGDWYMGNKSVNKDTYIIFDGLSMTMTQPTGTAPGEYKYLKMYPASSPSVGGGSGNPSGDEWTGTGFALKDGYIVTNHHVIDNAKSIVVLGVNGNTSTEYKARVIGVDKNNDLALIKIDDYRFKGFTNVPYAVRNTTCEVGADVFVLGYPLTTYMGEEVKLTNGIVSSRTGYQGDVSTYQISAPVQPGNSGGPMFDDRGNIVGIVNAGIPGADNVGYAIKTSYLYNLVNTVSSTTIIPQNNTITGTSLAAKVKQVQKCVFFIKCKSN